MKQKLLAATVAGGLLIGAGFAAVAISSPGVASAQDDSTDSTDSDDSTDSTEEPNNVGPFENHGSVLEDVLSDLVEDGTIDQSQADAIVEALDAKTAEFRTVAQDLRGLISGFLEDGVITAEELDQLPDVFPFNNLERVFGDALDDGELTLDEFQEAFPQPKRDRFRFGALLDDGGIDQGEYDSLAEHHPLKQVDVSGYLADGIISLDELRELKKSQSDSGDAA